MGLQSLYLVPQSPGGACFAGQGRLPVDPLLERKAGGSCPPDIVQDAPPLLETRALLENRKRGWPETLRPRLPNRSLLETLMTYVVTDNCIRCKYTDCVEVCPVDCFYEGENFLVIHPDECIDCGVCEPECPAGAIKPDTEKGLDMWLKLNAEFAPQWPNITVKRDALPEAKEMDGVDGKYEKFFSPNPGTGDA